MRRRAFVLSDDEQQRLLSLVRRTPAATKLALRSFMVLKRSERHAADAVARELGISAPTIRKWRRRYLEAAIPGLRDHPRQGRPCLLAPKAVQRLVMRVLERPPPDRALWRTRLSRAMIGRAWKEVRKLSCSNGRRWVERQFADDGAAVAIAGGVQERNERVT
jgi:transposase